MERGKSIEARAERIPVTAERMLEAEEAAARAVYPPKEREELFRQYKANLLEELYHSALGRTPDGRVPIPHHPTSGLRYSLIEKFYMQLAQKDGNKVGKGGNILY